MITHQCHWPSCQVIIPPAMWGCRQHWFSLPRDIRNAILRAYTPSQEKTKTPSPAYMAAAKKARAFALQKIEGEPKTAL